MAGELNVNASKRSQIPRTSERGGITEGHGVNVHIASQRAARPGCWTRTRWR